MTSKALRNLLCALAASATWAIGTPAHAVVYNVGFDPTLFGGIITIDVAPGCLIPFPDTTGHACAFDVTNVNFTDGAGTQWFDPSVTEFGIGQVITLDSGDNITGIKVDISNLEPVKGDNFCDGQHLIFALDGTVDFTCGGFPDHEAEGTVTFIRRVPEPATFALLGIGLLGLAAARRRQRR